MASWGWYGPIPIILPTTYYNMTFCVKLYGSLTILFFSSYKKKHVVLVNIILLLALFGSLEYERCTLCDFNKREDLIMFLSTDSTNTMEYTTSFNCEDFSRTLIQEAKKSGYRLYYYSTFDHALCKAYLIKENKWVIVEPQTDEIFLDI